MSSAFVIQLLKCVVLLAMVSCFSHSNIHAPSEAQTTSLSGSMRPVLRKSQSSSQFEIPSADAQFSLDKGQSPQFLFSLTEKINLSGWTTAYTSAFPMQLTADNQELAIHDSIPIVKNLEQYSILQEFGCTQMIRRSYQNGARQVVLDLYQFSTPQGAYAAYSLLRNGSTATVTRGDASSEDEESISFCKRNYFIRIYTTSQDDEDSKNAVSTIAANFDASIGSSSQLPSVLSRLPVLDRVLGSEKLVMGPISGRKFFPVPYLEALGLNKATAAATADYQFQRPYRERMKLLIVDYGKDNTAQVAYCNYVNSLRSTHEEHEEQESAGMLNIFKVSGSYLLCQLRRSQVVLVTGAHKRLSSIILAKNVL